MKKLQVAKLTKDKIVVTAETKYINRRRYFLNSLDRRREAMRRTNPISIADK